VRSNSQSAYTTRITYIGPPSGMDITKMRFEQGYAVASASGDIRPHPKDPVYLNCRASEPQASLHAQSCVAYSAYGTTPGFVCSQAFEWICLYTCTFYAWHTMPRAGVMQVQIIVFHPVFAKYLCLARDCCPDAQSLKFTKKLVETAKWYFKNEADDFTPVMQNMFQKYLVGVAGLSSIGDGKSSTDFSMQVMCLMSSSCICFCKSISIRRC